MFYLEKHETAAGTSNSDGGDGRHQLSLPVVTLPSWAGCNISFLSEPRWSLVPRLPPATETTCFSRTTGTWLKVVKAWPPGAHGKSWVLGREPELGPWPVARGLSIDGSEGEVDAWTTVVVLLGHLVLGDTHTHTHR